MLFLLGNCCCSIESHLRLAAEARPKRVPITFASTMSCLFVGSVALTTGPVIRPTRLSCPSCKLFTHSTSTSLDAHRACLRIKSSTGTRSLHKSGHLVMSNGSVEGAVGAGGAAGLSGRDLLPVICSDGTIADPSMIGRVGVFAIFDAEQNLVYVGISRDCGTSLRKCLARKPLLCWYYTAEYVSRPSRAAMEALSSKWIAEWENTHGTSVPGCDGGVEQEKWESAINVRGPHVVLSEDEKISLDDAEGSDLPKILRGICRRVQDEIEETLRSRGLKENLKFAPKMKGNGLLDVESVKIKVPDTIGASTKLPDPE